jgi:hypothetical protein
MNLWRDNVDKRHQRFDWNYYFNDFKWRVVFSCLVSLG